MIEKTNKYSKPKKYWSYEKCKELIESYNKKFLYEFIKDYNVAYRKIKNKNWFDLLDKFDKKRYNNGKWCDIEKCKNEALKYETKTEFYKGSCACVVASMKNGWYADITSHMNAKGSKYKRLVYVYEFSDNTCYVGLTYNPTQRHIDHMRNNGKSPVSVHKEKTGLEPIFIILSDYMDVGDAQQLEDDTKNHYSIKGWCVLNKAKTGRNIGSVGGSILSPWTKEKCHEEALKYESKTAFYRGCSGAYNYSRKNGWYDEITSHMLNKKNINIYEKNYDMCKEEALKYDNLKDFRKHAYMAYSTALYDNWLVDITKHMDISHEIKTYDINKNKKVGDKKNKNGYWTYAMCKKEAVLYKNRSTFKRNSSSAFTSARKNGWLEDICSHMEYKHKQKPNGYWTYEKCEIEASKYSTRLAFKLGSCGAYKASIKNLWLDDLCSSMGYESKNSWTYEKCKEAALKYDTRNDFKKSCVGGYDKARIKKWLDEFYPKNNNQK